MKNKTALVTGANGFIGRYVARSLGEKGWYVIGLGHGVWPQEEWRKWNIAEWNTSDINIDTLLTYAGEPDIIVHCAGSGSVGFSVSHPFDDFQMTVGTMSSVLEFVRRFVPSAKVVVPSSAAVYGKASKLPTPEDELLAPVSPYGVHKKMSEELCQSYGRHYRVASAVVRLFSVYGPGLHKQLLWDACGKITKNNNVFFGTGDETRDLLHINDAVELLYAAVMNASHECFIVNGGFGAGITVREIVGEISRSFESKVIPFFNGSYRPGDPAHYSADITRALDIGWSPKIDWRSGIREYVRWFKEGQ